MRQLLLAAVFCVFVNGGVLQAKPQLRALVVGVDAYPEVQLLNASPNLAKPSKDAIAVAESLEKNHGYSVDLLADPAAGLNRFAIEVKWAEMLDRAQDRDVVLFYFAGHGVELKGNYYLLPHDARYHYAWPDQERLEKLTGSSIEFQSLLDRLGEKQQKLENLVGIFIIDACRENPFDFTAFSKGKVLIQLGPDISPKRQIFIMYSAGSGQKASDGAKDAPHSVFAKELLSLMKQQDLPLSDMVQHLRFDVYKAALQLKNAQTPAYYDQLQSRLTLAGEHGDKQIYDEANLPEDFSERSLAHRDVLIECPYCPELVVLRTGTFQMGLAGHKANEAPPHSVVIRKRFAIGKFEVTNREWNACVREGGCAGNRRPDDLKPVADVSWNEADGYVRWLSVKTHHTYRLPAEAEWEYAARAGTETFYSFDGGATQLCEYANGADRSMGLLPYTNRACDDGVGRETSIVGRYKPNPWGLYDMHGNVWEWVQDCWHENYDGAPDGGSSWDDAHCVSRVARGGSWRSGPEALHSAVRNAFHPGHRRATLGFRVVRDISD